MCNLEGCLYKSGRIMEKQCNIIIPTVFRQKIFDEDTILSELNPLLYEEVVTCGIINYIKECDFFRTCREDLQGWILNSCDGLQAI